MVRRGRADESDFNPRKPWDSIFLRAANDEQFWQQNVRETALMFMASLKAKPEITDEGHHAGLRGIPAAGVGQQQLVDKGPATGKRHAQNVKRREKLKELKRAVAAGSIGERAVKTPPPDRRPDAKGRGKRAKQECFNFTRNEAGCTTPCPNGRAHPA